MLFDSRDNRIQKLRRQADYFSASNGRPLLEEITDDINCNLVGIHFNVLYEAESPRGILHLYGERKINDNELGF